MATNAAVQAVTTPASLTKAQFNIWYEAKVRDAVDDPFDVLYGTTHSSAYYWFAQILWLKTSINALFSFSQAADPSDALYNWQIWMNVLLCISVVAMIKVNPYVNSMDQEVELVCLLCLACIAQVGSLSKAGA